jgi:hypothetical protein
MKRSFIERITHGKSLFLIVLLSSVLWFGVLLILYIYNPSKELPVDLIKIENNNAEILSGFDISDFEEFNIRDDHFELTGDLWFIFDPLKHSIKDFSDFIVLRGKIIEKSEVIININSSKIKVIFPVKLSIKSKINHADFPFDKHRVDVIFTHILPKQKAFISDSNLFFNVSKTALKRGWQSYALEAKAGLKEGSTPSLVFSIYVKRESIKIFILSFLPLLLIFLIGLMTLSFDVWQHFNAVLTLAVGSLTGFLFCRNLIDNITPFTEQFTIVDKLFVLMIMLVVFILAIQIYSHHHFRKIYDEEELKASLEKSISRAKKSRGLLLILFVMIFFIAVIFMFF